MVEQAMPVTPKPKTDPDQQFAIRLMEHLVVPTFVLDGQSRVLVWNKACERLTGLLAEEVLHTSNHWQAFYDHERPCLADLVIQADYSSIRTLYDNCDAFGLSDVGVSVENWCVMPRIGHKLYLAFDAGPIYDDSGALIAVVETVRDITVQQAAQKTLEGLAASDGLTGLANRRSFDLALASETKRAARHDGLLSLLMIDVDCFKAYNDAYGHQKGDECLRAVAQAIAQEVKRAGDVPARYGGEEFAVILPETDIEQAAVVAERIRCAVARLGIVHQNSSADACVTISIGAAAGKGTDLDAVRLLASADQALYKSKHEGRNRVTTVELEPALLLF